MKASQRLSRHFFEPEPTTQWRTPNPHHLMHISRENHPHFPGLSRGSQLVPKVTTGRKSPLLSAVLHLSCMALHHTKTSRVNSSTNFTLPPRIMSTHLLSRSSDVHRTSRLGRFIFTSHFWHFPHPLLCLPGRPMFLICRDIWAQDQRSGKFLP